MCGGGRVGAGWGQQALHLTDVAFKCSLEFSYASAAMQIISKNGDNIFFKEMQFALLITRISHPKKPTFFLTIYQIFYTLMSNEKYNGNLLLFWHCLLLEMTLEQKSNQLQFLSQFILS